MLPEELYLNLIGENKNLLQISERQEIYLIAKDYVKWKNENNYFDFNDVINYILVQIKKVFFYISI